MDSVSGASKQPVPIPSGEKPDRSEKGFKKIDSFWIGPALAPDMKPESRLGQDVSAHPELARGDPTGGDLPQPEYQGQGELAEGKQAGGGLSQPEEKAHPELTDCQKPHRGVPYGDPPDGQSADRDDAPGHDSLAGLGANAAGIMYQRQTKHVPIRPVFRKIGACGIEKLPPGPGTGLFDLVRNRFHQKILHAVSSTIFAKMRDMD